MQATEAGSEIEQEWKRVDRLLAKKDEASSAIAVVEAQKIFVQVLEEVSYGATVDDKIYNAAGLFGNVGKILEAQILYEDIVLEIGYVVKNQEAKAACDAWLSGVMDLLGRDFEPRGTWAKMGNSLNFFWGHHPKFLTGLLLAVLGYVAMVWFFTDMAVGQWLAMVGAGFARFVLDRPALMVGLAAALLISWLASRAFGARRRD
jgi:hypothetical protein